MRAFLEKRGRLFKKTVIKYLSNDFSKGIYEMKIVITDLSTLGTDADISAIKALGETVAYGHTSKDEVCDRIRDAQIVICNKTLIGKREIDCASELKCILLFATGYNNIDIEYARERGIAVCNAGQYSTYAVAQHTFALILRQASRVAEFSDFVAEGGWIRSPLFSSFEFSTCELYEKTLGIIGYGSIGRAVADIALAFGMKVIVSTRTPKNDGRVEFVSFDELLERSDYISAHCPLTDKTANLFDAKAFEKCRDGAFFVNTSRGGVVDERALADALNKGKLSGAALDVLTTEPMRSDCPLIGAKNLTVTPHTAWIPIETRRRLIGIVEENLKAFLAGTPKNRVN